MRLVRLLLIVALAFVPRAASAQGGARLGPEFRVNTFTTGSQFAPNVATDVGGVFVVVWESLQDGSGNGVFGQRYAGSGVPMGPEFRVNTFTTGNQFGPVASAEISGSFVVVWVSELQDGSGLGVFGQRYSSSGAPLGLEFRVNAFVTGDQLAPSVATDKSGTFVVVWTSDGQDGSGFGVFGQRFAPVGVPLGPEFRVNTETAAGQRSPSVAVTEAANFVVVWESDAQDGSNFGIFGQRYSPLGVSQGPEFRANAFTTGNQHAPAAAATSNVFVVVWQSHDQDGSGYGVFGQRFADGGAPLGPEFLVNGFTGGDQSDPSMAMDISGDFAVVWESYSQDGEAAGVFGQRFVSSGTPLGPEFRVNTYTTAGQRRASVVSTFSGDFVVVWASDVQDGSGYGIFGQRYAPIVPVELMRVEVE